MQREGQIRIPSGCAVAGIIDRSGQSMSGEAIIRSIAVMHDRSNGLGIARSGADMQLGHRDTDTGTGQTLKPKKNWIFWGSGMQELNVKISQEVSYEKSNQRKGPRGI